MTIDINKQPKRLKEEDVVSLYAKDITPRNFNSPQPEQPKAVNTNEEPMANGSEPNGLDLYKQDLTGSQDPNTVFMDEIHKAISEKNYKSLLQSDIAAYNLKMNAQKYLDNSLAAQGLGTQGYGTTAHVGIENQAQNLYAQNLENYNQAESDALLEAQERKSNEEKEAQLKAETEARESDNQLFALLLEADGSEKKIAKAMDDFGYAKAEDGKWYRKDATGNPDKSLPVSSNIQTTIDYASEKATNPYGTGSTDDVVANAQNFLNAYASSKDIEGNPLGYESVEELKKAKVNTGDDANKDRTIDYAVGHELAYLEKQINGGTVKDGTLFKLQAGADKREAYLVLYLNGMLYIVSESDDETEGGEVDTKYKEYTGPKREIIGK